MRRLIQILSPAIAIVILYSTANAEDLFLVIQATDTQGRPIADIVITATGDSSQHITDVSGKARIKLAPETKPNDEVTLLIVRSPKKKDLVFVSPWNKRVRVPPFDNATQHVAEIVLAERGNRILLESDLALVALASLLNAATAPKSINEKTTDERRKEALIEVSKAFGLKPEDIDKAIRAWGERRSDPYEKGLAALYEENYPKATKELTKTLEIREKELKQKQDGVADAARFLGQSLYQQGKYRESVAAYRKAAALSPGNAQIMNDLGASLNYAGRYAEAEPLLKKALTIDEKALGPDHPDVANSLNNLAFLYHEQGKYTEAEPLYKKALAIRKKALGPDHPDVANSLSNLAVLYFRQGRYAEAELPHKRALAIRERSLGPDHPDVANSLNNLAVLYFKQGRYAEAEPLYKRALAINEKALGSVHPSLALALENYAALLRKAGRVTEAARMEARAKDIRAKHAQQNQKK